MELTDAELRRLHAVVSAQDVVLQALLSLVGPDAYDLIRSRALSIADHLGHPQAEDFVILSELERLATLRETAALLARGRPVPETEFHQERA